MVELNHTIVWCKDQKRSSAFLAEMLVCPRRRASGISTSSPW